MLEPLTPAPATPATPRSLAAELLAGSLHDYLLRPISNEELADALAADLEKAGLLADEPQPLQPNDAAAVKAVRENAETHEGVYMSRGVALRLIRLIDNAYSIPTP